MNEIKNIIAKLRKDMPMLKKNYGVKTLHVFGSRTRGRSRKGSDLDILVEISRTIDLFKFIELEDCLSEKLGIKVDLVMKDVLKPRIKDSVLKEALPV